MAISKKTLLFTLLPLTLAQILARHPYGSDLAYRNAFAKQHVAAYDDPFDIYQRNIEDNAPIGLYSRDAEAYDDYENLVLVAARSILAREPGGGITSGGFGGFRNGEIYVNKPPPPQPHQWPTTPAGPSNTLGSPPNGEKPNFLRGDVTGSILQNGQTSGSSSVNTQSASQQPVVPPQPPASGSGSSAASGSGSGVASGSGMSRRKGFKSTDE